LPLNPAQLFAIERGTLIASPLSYLAHTKLSPAASSDIQSHQLQFLVSYYSPQTAVKKTEF
jgi:hypothetical protein